MQFTSGYYEMYVSCPRDLHGSVKTAGASKKPIELWADVIQLHILTVGQIEYDPANLYNCLNIHGNWVMMYKNPLSPTDIARDRT